MNHPELGVLTPARFLDALLANGAGPALTHRMLQGTAQSLKRLAQYNPAGDWTYAVNVTGDLPIQDNPQWLRKHVEAVGLDPASLIIEVPEGTLSNDVSAWHRVLTQARLMGSGVSLDDFGCHAANLERLLLLPLSEVKVDRMFLEHAVHDQDARRLLESMNLMIKNLGLVMAYAEMAPLIRLVGEATTLEILLEGRIFDAAEAKDKGLVTRVVPDERVGAEVDETARRIADGAPLVARWHKRFARRLGETRPLSAAELDECFDCFDTEDFRIGYAAFLAKRRPRFEGR
jgi:hypothetical protein